MIPLGNSPTSISCHACGIWHEPGEHLPQRRGETPIGSDTREPAEQAREASAMSRGLDAMNADELTATIQRLADALRTIKARCDEGFGRDEQEATRFADGVAMIAADALAAEDLE